MKRNKNIKTVAFRYLTAEQEQAVKCIQMDLKKMSTKALEKELKSLRHMIAVVECFGVRDLKLEMQIAKELDRRAEELDRREEVNNND